MAAKEPEGPRDAEQARARRILQEQARRWPQNPRFYQIALLVVLLLILLLALF